ncbi:Geraniol synthase, chloroplastic [Cinnamomum micranthum f. kanehirae]|uniref:Geraniol synthase, chloroplastic n=1 Tax=Cinnamomum micranthum f. kanehirae TaxID=337451 RepID=A0A3S3NJR3_9MAGN|nr:Geraniol synthase, chloroplastic [Cinnamomum micranthum f. kanehirae]
MNENDNDDADDVFNDFKDEKGCFKPSLSTDIKGMLSLYDASHLAFQGETVLDEARAFTSTHLMDIKENIDPILHKKVEHALDMPLHWRWDLEALKTCFLALYNSINEIGYEILKEEGRNVIPYLRNTWTELCKAFLVEAKWYSSGYTPTLEEYLQTSWISIGSLPMQTYVFALLGKNLAPESSDFAEKISNILPLGGMMIRLPDDLGTSIVCSH